MDVLLDLETFTRTSKLSPSPSPLAVGSSCFQSCDACVPPSCLGFLSSARVLLSRWPWVLREYEIVHPVRGNCFSSSPEAGLADKVLFDAWQDLERGFAARLAHAALAIVLAVGLLRDTVPILSVERRKLLLVSEPHRFFQGLDLLRDIFFGVLFG